MEDGYVASARHVPRVLRSQNKYLGIRVTWREEGERRVDRHI